ncbi:PBP1A family penicillin-binding protein [Campylobacter sp. RM12327]|uniref:transglycosylase domain-containing protein n=1 Tax=Campylobacter sputorum TaxID=206 RepID=UPI000B799B26|nr:MULTISPECIES: PBP1A family penicillin-binding protein [Campylobacter]ASM40641.1 penicillin-binding protein 1A [Campylobacter sputorum]MBE7357694.1 PBP1A family penicillin-binding protein [Campylobacter sp. RM11302]MBF6668972.1 PBP1A family penicillin-binding protein [Campylobacter sp. RM12327]MBF6674019.1 PBP1A family penicillin-binding protein [Campylobacter sp. RM13538]MBF6675922.1 PBP1A family penicillin-binding protein [Campylobacter sp. RM12321]
MRYIFGILFACFVALALFIGKLYSDIHFEAYSIIDYNPRLTTQIYDRNGELIANVFDDENRLYVDYKDIPGRIIEALVAIEDTSFFEHEGINIEAIFRALIKDIKAMKLVEGASTITQQLIKNVALSPEKKIIRKMKEAVLAYEVENKLTKEQILERYLNHVYFGHGYYGIKTAANGYFRKTLDELTLKEISMLVGMPKAPSAYDPTKHMDLAISRANSVISRMYDLGWINKNEYEIALAEEPKVYNDTLSKNRAPYVVDEVIKEASLYFSDIRIGGYIIQTSIDLQAQDKAVEALRFGYNEILKRDKDANSTVLNGALIATHPQSGDILALVGGVDYNKSNYNRATQATRQLGSSFKPFIYQLALNLGYSPMSKIPDVARVFENANAGEDWTPKNYGNKYKGFITLKEALRDSRNLATINLLNQIGLDVAYQKLTELGFSGVSQDLSIALGSFGVSPLEASRFYSMFPNLGEIVEPKLIRKVTNKFGITKIYDSKRAFIMEPEQAYLMVDMLQTVVNEGTGRRARVDGVEIGGKTGTTNNNVDAWFCGFAPELAVMVWYGNDNNTPMKKVEGGARTSGPVFKKFVEDYKKLNPDMETKFVKPDGVKSMMYQGKEAFYTDKSPLPNSSQMDNLNMQESEGLIF